MERIETPILVVMNVQRGYDYAGYGKRNGMFAEARMKELLSIWRERELPVIHTQFDDPKQSSPLHRTNAGFHFKDGFKPQKNEQHLIYSSYSTFIEQVLTKEQKPIYIFVGFSLFPHIATVSQVLSTSDSHQYIVADATVSFEKISFNNESLSADEVHFAILTSMMNDETTVITSFMAKQLAVSAKNIGKQKTTT
ncbi:hypothetical protein [Bacillus kexueae]|uniref:hypothetical protein n=1 Tax=Aeribacillus kexueae TaxID=2078952 RepID=UPI001FB030A1|nr:hypothetical protein [Bacillus kexueae]